MTGSGVSSVSDAAASMSGETARGGSSYAEFGAIIGRTKQRVGQMVAEGKIPTLPSGKIDTDRALAAIREAALRAAAAIGAMPEGAGAGASLATPQEQRQILALRRETMDYLERAGRLTDANAVALAQGEIFRRLRDRILGLARRIGEECAGAAEPRIAEARARALLLEALSGVADELDGEAERLEPGGDAALPMGAGPDELELDGLEDDDA